MRKIVDYIILTRPVNCLIALISVWGGAIAASDIYFSSRIIAASLSAAMIAGFGNIVNDLHDIEIDRINKQSRPLASAAITPKGGTVLAIVLAIIGVALSPAVHIFAPLLALPAVILLLIYTPLLKGTYYFGNLVIALLSSLAFVFGGLAVDRPLGAWILIIFAFLLHFGREIIKDIHDREADLAAGLKTGAAIGNARPSQILAVITLSLLFVATLFPFLLRLYGLTYLVIIAIVDVVLIVSILKLALTRDAAAMKAIAFHLKVIMPLGLLAVLLGQWG